MISYNKLWKLLIDKNMNKTQLRIQANLSSTTLAKLSKNESVTVSTLEKICFLLDCNIEDIVEIKKE